MAGAGSPEVADRNYDILTGHTWLQRAALRCTSFKAVNLDDEDDDEEVETKAEPETGSEPLQSEAQGLEWTHTVP